MIKLLAIDLDGVLADIKHIHFKALNEAIKEVVGEQYTISYEEHIKEYDGLPTNNKLYRLTEKKGMPTKWSLIHDLKQKKTLELLESEVEFNLHLFTALHELHHSKKYKIYCCSNSICNTIVTVLKKLRIYEFFDGILSNEDVTYAKPSASIYLKAMLDCGISPHETLIFEDSPKGIKSASNSAANYVIVPSSKWMTFDNINREILKYNQEKPMIYKNNKLNVVIPMSGAGKRFKEAGYELPKFLIDVAGKPMIERVVNSLKIEANYIFIVQKEHRKKYNLDIYLSLVANGSCRVIEVDGQT